MEELEDKLEGTIELYEFSSRVDRRSSIRPVSPMPQLLRFSGNLKIWAANEVWHRT